MPLDQSPAETQDPSGDALSHLLADLGAEAPAGVDLRRDVTPQAAYSALRDARAEARAAERLADEDPTAPPPRNDAWRRVEQLARAALAEQSKDIEIAAWLTEALTRRAGLDGLAQGAALLAGLIRHFWSRGLHPAPDEEDPEGRLAAIAGLNGQDRDGSLLQPLRKLVLFEGDDGAPVTLWLYERSSQLAGMTDDARAALRVSAGVPNYADLEAAARTRGRSGMIATARAVRAAIASWAELEAAIEANVPPEAGPPTGRVRGVLDAIGRIAERYAPAEAIEPPSGETHAAVSIGDAVPVTVTTEIAQASRERLLAEILRLASIFREREPHSPISYTLEEAVRRARLSLLELLREMVPDTGPRSAMLTGLGIRPPAD